jgi:hypothetical protein
MTKLIVIFRKFAKTPKKSRNVVQAGASRLYGEKTHLSVGESEENRPLEGSAIG